MRKTVNWILIGVVLLVVVVVAAVVGGVVWLRSEWGHGFVRGQIETRLENAMIGDVRLGSVEGDILTGVTLHDFALIGPEGTPLIAAERVQVGYALRPFLDQRIVIGHVRLVRPEINLIRGTDGRWNFQTLWKPRPPRAPGPPGWGSHIDIGTIEIVDGTVDVVLTGGRWPVLDWDENRFLDVNGTLGLGIFSRDRSLKRFKATDFSFRATSPELVVRRLDGAGIVTPDSLAFREIAFVTAGSEIHADGQLALAPSDSFALEITAPRLDMDEVRRFFPVVRVGGTGSYEGRLTGPANNPSLIIRAARVETGRSTVAVEGAIRTLADAELDLAGTVAPLAPADAELFIDSYPFVQPVTGEVRVAGPPGRLDIEADLRAPAGSFSAVGTVGFTGPLSYDLAVASRDLDIGALTGNPDVDIVLTGTYRIDGRGTGARELRADFSGVLDRSTIYRWDLLSLETSGRIEGRTYLADTLIARMPRTVLRGTGVFGLASDGVIDAELALESEDLEEVWPGLGEFSGRARADASLEGTYQGFDVVGEAAAADLILRGVEADSFTGEVAFHEVGGPLMMEVDGTFRGLRVGALTADTAAVVLDYADERMNLSATLAHPGQATTRLTGVADFTGPQMELALDELVYASPESTWRMTEGSHLVLTGGTVRADEVRIAEDGQMIRFDGTLALSGGESDLAFAADSVDLREIARLTGREPEDWTGRADIEGTFRGSRLDPRIELRGEVSEGTIGGFRFVRIGGEIDYVDEQAAVDIRVVSPTEGHYLEMTGIVPVDLALAGRSDRLPDRPVDLQIRGTNTDLSLLGALIPGLTDLAGPIELRVDITGTTDTPRFAGLATVREGQFTISATGVTYQDIAGRVDFNNDRIRIESLTGTDGGRGRFEIEGQAAMENLRLGELDFTGTATDLEVVDQTQKEIQVNAALDLTGTTLNPVITGRVVVDEAIYRLPERSDKNVIDLDEAVVYVEIPGAPRQPESRTPSLWRRTRVDLDLEVTDDAVLTASNARIEIAGDLAFIKPTGIAAPTLSGTLDVRRGFYEEFGQRFVIEGGEVFFYGTPDLNPGLHVVATRTVQNVEGVGDVNIRIIVGGTLKQPTIDLESTPAFDRSEILAIALFGTPSPSGAEQGRFADAATGLVTGTLSGPLQVALSEELNLDLFEFGQRTDAGESTSTLFRVGKFISADVFVGFENVSGGDEEGQAVSLRYQVSNSFTLQATAGAGDLQSGVDLFWEFTY